MNDDRAQPDNRHRSRFARSNFASSDRRTAERYRALAQLSGQIVWTATARGMEDGAPGWRTFTGQSAEAVTGRGWLDAVHPADRERAERAWDSAVATGTPYEQRFRICRHDGLYRQFQVRAAPIKASDGTIKEWFGICADSGDVEPRADQQLQAIEEAEAARAQAEARSRRLQAALDILPVGVYIADANGRLEQRNQAAATIWGKDAPLVESVEEYAHYRGWHTETGEMFSPDEWALARTLRTGQPALNDEVTIEGFDGLRKITLHSAAPIRDEQGKLIGAAVAIVDITEQKRLEDLLSRAAGDAAARAAELEAIFEGITDGMIVCDDTGRLLHMNAGYRHLMGLEQVTEDAVRSSEARGQLFSPRDSKGQRLSADQRPMARILQGAVLSSSLAKDYAVRTVDGRTILLNASGAPIRDATGTIVGGVAIFRDVTERRRLETRTQEALQALLAMAQAVVLDPVPNSAAEVSAAANGTQKVVELTRSMLGCRRVSLAIYEPDHGLVPLTAAGLSETESQIWRSSIEGYGLQLEWPPEELAIFTALQSGQIVTIDMAQPPFTERPNPLAVRSVLIAPIRGDNGLAGILTVDHASMPHDYTDDERLMAGAVANLAGLVIDRARLHHEQALATARELSLAETNRRMNEFLGIAGHELRTPLTSITANAQLAQRRLSRVTSMAHTVPDQVVETIGPIRELVSRIYRQTGRINRLVEDLLDVSRIEAEELDLRIGRYDLLAVIREAVQDQRQLESARTIVLELLDADYLVLEGDSDRIAQVLTNYLTNALKYSRVDQPVTVGSEIESDEVREWVRVWVHDAGPGLTSEEMEHIWQRFYRAASVQIQSGSGVGLGLGLHISRTIVERHGGRVGVESEKGVGSTFWFLLPITAESETATS